MGWFDAVDYYCERLGPGFAGEPFNMLTGLAFLAVGLFAFRRAPAVEDRLAAAALGLAAVSLVGGVSATLYQARRAERRFQQVRALAP